MRKILVIGSLNVDLSAEVDHIPAPGETILCSRMRQIPGGKGANQACAAGKLGGDVSMLGALGTDAHAGLLCRSLEDNHVDTTHLLRRMETDTGMAFITVAASGENSIVVIPGANATLGRADIDDNLQLIKESDLLVMQLEIPIDTVLYAAKRAKAYGKTVILDPAPAPLPGQFPDELFRYVDYIKPNETELGLLLGADETSTNSRLSGSAAKKRTSGIGGVYGELPAKDAGLVGPVHSTVTLHQASFRDDGNPDEVLTELIPATDCLIQKGVGHVIVTLGSKGVFINDRSETHALIPPVKVKAVDSTAAGDVFTGALAVRLSEGYSLRDAASYANRAAAVSVTRKGAQTSLPSAQDVEALCD